MSKIKPDDVKILARKLAETEARILSRLLLSAQQVLKAEDYDLLCKKFEDNKSLDLLEMERTISANATLLSDTLGDLYESVVAFRDAKRDFDDYQRGLGMPDQNPQELHDTMVRRREKMFSLASEYEIKERYTQPSF